MFALICSGILVVGNASHIDVSGHNEALYAPHVRLFNGPYVRLANGNMFHLPPGVYDDGGQFQVTVARDHSRIWIQSDSDDNPGERGIMFPCKDRK